MTSLQLISQALCLGYSDLGEAFRKTMENYKDG